MSVFRFSKFIIASSLSALLMSAVACGDKKKEIKASEVISNPMDSADAANAPVISFKKIEYDFGKVQDGELVKYNFKFTNTGKSPLIISGATASCGCTVPKPPDDPIAVGESSEIEVEFNSKGRVGPVNKTITVIANTNPSRIELLLKGEVEPKK